MRIAGHDDHPFSRFTCPSLTTVAQDYESISEWSVEALFSLIEGWAAHPVRAFEKLFEGKLIMRASALHSRPALNFTRVKFILTSRHIFLFAVVDNELTKGGIPNENESRDSCG